MVPGVFKERYQLTRLYNFEYLDFSNDRKATKKKLQPEQLLSGQKSKAGTSKI
jgi:hypothetical protein